MRPPQETPPGLVDEAVPLEMAEKSPSRQNAVETETPEETKKKSLGFKMSVLALVIMGLVCSLDGTILAVATPVCQLSTSHYCYSPNRRLYLTIRRQLRMNSEAQLWRPFGPAYHSSSPL